MTAEVHQMPEPKLRLHCVECGVTVEAACNCGAGYVTAAEAVKFRRARVAVLYQQGLTQQQIAERLSISQQTIGRDLESLSIMDKPPRPKGGRPMGSKKKRKFSPATEQMAATLILDEGKTKKEASKATGVSDTVIRHAVAREEGRREAMADPEIDVTTLSMTAQQKLAAAERQMRKRVFREAEEAARAQMVKRMEDLMMPAWRKQFDESTQVIKARKGALSEPEYKKLLRCIHPDTRNSASQELLREVYEMISARKLVLVAEKENPTATFKVPTTEEVMRGWR